MTDMKKIAKAHVAIAKAHLELAALLDRNLAPELTPQERRDRIVELMPASPAEIRAALPHKISSQHLNNDLHALQKQGRIKRLGYGSYVALKKKRR